MDGMNDLQLEIEQKLTAFVRNLEKYEVESDRNPYYRGEAEGALKFATQLAQIEQAAQLRRIADALEVLASK